MQGNKVRSVDTYKSSPHVGLTCRYYQGCISAIFRGFPCQGVTFQVDLCNVCSCMTERPTVKANTLFLRNNKSNYLI